LNVSGLATLQSGLSVLDRLTVSGLATLQSNLTLIPSNTTGTARSSINYIYLNDNPIYFRGSTNKNNLIGYQNTNFGGTTVDGVVIAGLTGGILATTSGSDNYSLFWDSQGNALVRNFVFSFGTQANIFFLSPSIASSTLLLGYGQSKKVILYNQWSSALPSNQRLLFTATIGLTGSFSTLHAKITSVGFLGGFGNFSDVQDVWLTYNGATPYINSVNTNYRWNYNLVPQFITASGNSFSFQSTYTSGNVHSRIEFISGGNNSGNTWSISLNAQTT
jgi:hypothetical protein